MIIFSCYICGIILPWYSHFTFLFTLDALPGDGDPEVLARKLPKSIGALAEGYKLELPWLEEGAFAPEYVEDRWG